MANVPYPTSKRRKAVQVSESKTFSANDAGIVQDITGADVTITLPATANVTVRSAGVPAGGPVGSGANKSQVIKVTGTVTGLGSASGAATLTLAKAVQTVGDEVEIVNGVITRVVGDWVRS